MPRKIIYMCDVCGEIIPDKDVIVYSMPRNIAQPIGPNDELIPFAPGIHETYLCEKHKAAIADLTFFTKEIEDLDEPIEQKTCKKPITISIPNVLNPRGIGDIFCDEYDIQSLPNGRLGFVTEEGNIVD